MATTVAAVVWLLLLVAPSSLQISYAQSTVGMGESDGWASACDELLAPQYCDYLNPVKLEGVREQPNYNFTEGVIVFNWFSQAYGNCPYSSLSFYPCSIRGVVCDVEGRVTEIFAPPCMNDLEPLPMEESVSRLERLQRLTLAGKLQGSLPEEWTALSRLQELEIHGSITGTLPPAYSRLTSLQRVALADSSVTGTLPASWSELSNLVALELTNNSEIVGTLPPQFSALHQQLYYFAAADSRLTGTLPTAFSTLTSLRSVILDNNRLTGTIPQHWSNLTRLANFSAAGNQLTGTLPPLFFDGDMRLQKLALSSNNLSGSLPREWSSARYLNRIGLGGNNLTGRLPEEWSDLLFLGYIDVANNNLTGTIPSSWSKMVFLSELYLSSNEFSGTLPTSYANFLRIRDIDASHNQLTGSIPREWSNMDFLFSLRLGNNSLTGLLPTARFPRIRTISLFSNSLGGSIPTRNGSGLYKEMLTLDLAYNKLEGTLPLHWSQAVSLEQLRLEGNRNFSGPLPEQWSLIIEITHLSLGGSLVSGPLPACYSTWEDIQEVDLDSNRLTGSLPSAYSTWTDLKHLNLSDNRLSGSLPAEYSRFTAMKELKLQKSALSGQLPGSWSTMRLVETITLEETALTGTVPSSWSLMDELKLLAVPPALCETIESDLLWAAATNDSYPVTCAPRESGRTTRIVALIALGCILGSVILLLVVLGLAVVLHRQRCRDPQCAHRHPGVMHALLGHLAPDMRTAACPWCMWDGRPDLGVLFNELEPLLVPEAIIGRGGFSKVYRGVWRGRSVAVKLLDVGVDDNKSEQRRVIANEVDVCVRCNECPRMVRLYGACLERFCIISEFVDGGTLDGRIHGEGNAPMALLEVLQVARDIAEGLAFLHPQLVHRDLKPQNVLLHRSGRAKIIDFGLGRVNDNPLRTHASTHVAGTAAYMSPEQCDGHVSQKVDIYALGVILNECLSGEMPFHNYSNPMQVQVAVLMRQERPAVAVGCPKAVRVTIERCWHTEPSKRPTAVELVFILDHLIQAEIGLREKDASTRPNSVTATASQGGGGPPPATPGMNGSTAAAAFAARPIHSVTL